jgi:hypothetical protein
MLDIFKVFADQNDSDFAETAFQGNNSIADWQN